MWQRWGPGVTGVCSAAVARVLLRDYVHAAARLTHVHAVHQAVAPRAVQLFGRMPVVGEQQAGAHEVAAYGGRHPAVLLVLSVRGDEVPHPRRVGHQGAAGAHAQQLDVPAEACYKKTLRECG